MTVCRILQNTVVPDISRAILLNCLTLAEFQTEADSLCVAGLM